MSIKISKSLSDLLHQGEEQGFLAQDDILFIFSEPEKHIEEIDEFFDRAFQSGIDIFESTSSQDEADAKKNAEDLEKELEQLALIKGGESMDPIKMYLKEIGRTPLINYEKEVDLAKRYEQGLKVIETYMPKEEILDEGLELAEDVEIERPEIDLTILTDEEKKIVEEGNVAKDALTKANLRLVVSIAKKYLGRRLSFLDLIQEGNKGLIRAVEKYDWRRGFKFSTYATWWIRQAITRAIADQSRTIRIPVHMVDQINRYYKIKRRITQSTGKEPTNKDIAKEMELPIEDVETIVRIAQQPKSLSTPVGDDKEATLEQFVADTTKPNMYDLVSRELLKDVLVEVLDTLSPRERKVLEMRFGLKDGKQRTLEEVGKEFNVTRERIRQIEAKAIRKLKHPTRSRKLKDFFE